ncbi:flavodoxin family protein [Candidatus Bathyarchaeota archaeon]|nr:flavodoxin family protein [Candidatus Bathyarchaeota archaeon]
MRVCGIVGSPKKNGNVDLLVSQVLKGARSRGAETVKIYLNNLQIQPCQSCGVNPDPKHCLFDDDMRIIYTALQSCDAIVLGSPVYFDTVSAQVKLMIDRCNCLMPYIKQSDGTFGFEMRLKKKKKGVFIAVAGSEQEFNTILPTVKGFFNWTNTELAKTIFYGHNDNRVGGVKKDKKKMKLAFEIGKQLVRLKK